MATISSASETTILMILITVDVAKLFVKPQFDIMYRDSLRSIRHSERISLPARLTDGDIWYAMFGLDIRFMGIHAQSINFMDTWILQDIEQKPDTENVWKHCQFLSMRAVIYHWRVYSSCLEFAIPRCIGNVLQVDLHDVESSSMSEGPASTLFVDRN